MRLSHQKCWMQSVNIIPNFWTACNFELIWQPSWIDGVDITASNKFYGLQNDNHPESQNTMASDSHLLCASACHEVSRISD